MMMNPEFERMWKTFGSSTAAGRLLREIYDPSSYLRASVKISYPKLSMKSSIIDGSRPKVVKTKVAVPKFRKALEIISPPVVLCGKRSASQIHAQLRLQQLDRKLPTVAEVDRELERRKLQERFQFSEATCLPNALRIPKQATVDPCEIPTRCLTGKDAIVGGLVDQIKQDQAKLEQWVEDVESFNFRGKDPVATQKAIDAKILQRMNLMNTISAAIRDIKTIVDSGN